MTIFFDEDNMTDEWTAKTMKSAFKYSLKEEHLNYNDNYCVSVSFVNQEEIHKLNFAYRNVDSPTDVLSFPMYEPGEVPVFEEETINADDEDIETMESFFDEDIELGDVVICTDKARSQAEEYGHSYERELIYLFVHSIFHLLGYDHEFDEEKAVMRLKEEHVMKKIGLEK